MDYNLIFVIVVINLLYVIFQNVRRGFRFRIAYLLQIAGLLLLFTAPYLRAIGASGQSGLPRPEVSLEEMLFLVVLFMAVVIGPGFLDLLRVNMIRRRRYAAALFFSRLGLFLDWSRYNRIRHALTSAEYSILRGRVERGRFILESAGARGVPSRLASAYHQNLIICYAFASDWERLVEFFEKLSGHKEKYLFPATISNAIRAYSELGYFDRAEELLEWQKRNLTGEAGRIETLFGRVVLAATRGDADETAQALGEIGSAPRFPKAVKPYWYGRALLHAGRYDEAVEKFQEALELVPTGDKSWKESVEKYIALAENKEGSIEAKKLDRPPEPLEDILDAGISEEEVEFQKRLLGSAPIVWAVVLANAAVFLILLFSGGSGDMYTLLKYGAHVESLIVEKGQWWRLLTATYLHANWIHIIFNMYGVLFIGVLCVKMYGDEGFLISYVAAALGGSLASLAMGSGALMSVGASGALFGAVGMLVAFGIRYRGRIPRRFRNLFGFGLVPWVILIFVLGILMRGIDNWAHLGGLVTGLIMGLALKPVGLEIGYGRTGRTVLTALGGVCGVVFLAGLLFVARPAWDEDYSYLMEYVDGENKVAMKVSPFWEKDPDTGGVFRVMGFPQMYYDTETVPEGGERGKVERELGGLDYSGLEGPFDINRGKAYVARARVPVEDEPETKLDVEIYIAIVRDPESGRTVTIEFVIAEKVLDTPDEVIKEITSSVRFLK